MLVLLLGAATALAEERPQYPWEHDAGADTLVSRVAPPPGFQRLPAAAGSFASWLRGLPLKPAGTPVHLFDGSLKGNQTAQAAVLDIDVGRRDLQQCADAVMRLRAEYLRASGRDSELCFRITSGDAIAWARWASGARPAVRGRQVTWASAARDTGYASFRRFLDFVFTYAGTFSLARDLTLLTRPDAPVEIGDVFVQGGFPGHAVIVVDAVQDGGGRRQVMLAQSYMPAQDIHVLLNPVTGGAWYPMPAGRVLRTPEWVFVKTTPRRFPEPSPWCGSKGR